MKPYLVPTCLLWSCMTEIRIKTENDSNTVGNISKHFLVSLQPNKDLSNLNFVG